MITRMMVMMMMMMMMKRKNKVYTTIEEFEHEQGIGNMLWCHAETVLT